MFGKDSHKLVNLGSLIMEPRGNCHLFLFLNMKIAGTWNFFFWVPKKEFLLFFNLIVNCLFFKVFNFMLELDVSVKYGGHIRWPQMLKFVATFLSTKWLRQWGELVEAMEVGCHK